MLSNYYMPGSMLSVSCILSVIFMLTRVFQEKHYMLLPSLLQMRKLRLGEIK
jgi:hypothetical protein